MAESLSNSKFQWHGAGSGYGEENSPKMYLNFTVTPSDDGTSVTYEVSLVGLSGLSYFGYPIRVYTSPPTPNNASSYENTSFIYKPVNPSQWSTGSYKGSKTVTVSPSDLDSEGYYTAKLYIATVYKDSSSGGFINGGCGCGGTSAHDAYIEAQTPIVLGKIQMLKPGKPAAPASCTVSPTTVLVGGSFTCTYDGLGVYKTRDANGVWSTDWIAWDWGDSGDSFTIPSDHSVSAVQMASYYYDDTYEDPWSDYTVSEIVYVKLAAPSTPSVSPNPVTLGGTVTASSTHPTGTVNYQWYNSSGTASGTGSTLTPSASGYYCKAYASKSNFVNSDYSAASASVSVKLPKPGCTFSPSQVIYGGTVTLGTATNVSGVTSKYQYHDSSGWHDLTGNTLSNVTSTGIYFRVYISKSGFVDSDWSDNTSAVGVKLPKPTCSRAPSPVLYGGSVTLSASSSPSVSLTTSHFQYSTSDNSTSGTNCSSPFTVKALNYRFRVYLSRSGYIDSDWSDWTSVVEVKLNQPSSLTLESVPMYNSLLSAFSKTANAATDNPSGLSTVWEYSTNNSTWNTWDGSHKITSSYIYVRAYYTKSGYVNSDKTSGTSGNTKLNPPSSITAGQPMYNSNLSDLSKTAGAATSGNPSSLTTDWQYRTSTSGSWTAWNGSHKVVSSYIYLRARFSKSGFISSDYVTGTSQNTKLNTPSSLSVSPDPVTVELSVTASVTIDAGATANYTWYKSNGTVISGQTGKTYTTNYSDGTGVYVKVKATRSGYADSEVSSASNSVDVYFEPRSMRTNGFVVNFTIPDTVVPGSEITTSWNDFKPSLNLGRFNYFKLEILYEDGIWKVGGTVDGTNNPTSTSSSSKLTVNGAQAGYNCKIRLSCFYKTGSTVLGAQTTAIFESSTFLVVGYPNQPEFYYPGVRDFKTCNLTPRLIFKVSNPTNFADTSIHDIRIIVKTNTKSTTYTFKNNKSMFSIKSGQISSTTIPNETVVVFTLPSSSEVRTIQVYCSNAYLECVNPEVVVGTYITTEYPVKGAILSNRNHREVMYNRVRDVLGGYQKLNGNQSLDELGSSTYPPVVKAFCIPLLSVLKSTYDAVLTYAPSRTSDISIGGIDTTTEYPPVVTDTEKFGTTLGNFFSDMYYVLKNML